LVPNGVLGRPAPKLSAGFETALENSFQSIYNTNCYNNDTDQYNNQRPYIIPVTFFSGWFIISHRYSPLSIYCPAMLNAHIINKVSAKSAPITITVTWRRCRLASSASSQSSVFFEKISFCVFNPRGNEVLINIGGLPS
jgi:hypothetical protein